MMTLNMTTKQKKVATAAVGAASLALLSTSALSIVAPEADTFGYTLYDVGVNEILNGAPGFVGGLIGVIWSATQIAKNWMFSLLGILGSTAVIQADAITTSLGMIV